MSKRLIRVTQEDIDSPRIPGERCTTCPVARAMTRALGYGVHVQGRWFLPKPNPSNLPMTLLPKRVTTWIENYDGRAAVKPFIFYLEVPND